MLRGKDRILMFQSVDAVLGSDAVVFGNSTEHTWNTENELIDEVTKSGRVLGYGDNSESTDCSAYVDTKDPGQNVIGNAIRDKKEVKVWEVDIPLNENGKHNARFAYALVESVEESASADGFVELSGTLQVMGQSQRGELDPLPAAVINFAQYGFETPGETTGEFTGEPKEPVTP